MKFFLEDRKKTPNFLNCGKFDGLFCLDKILTEIYGSVEDAVAENTVFAPVELENIKTFFISPSVRINKIHTYRKFQEIEHTFCDCESVSEIHNKKLIYLTDDNLIPHLLFLSCFKNLKRLNNFTQLNHIYKTSKMSPFYHANIHNLCLMPSFLAKLSDNHKKTKNIIKYRAYELFGKIEKEIPERPENYENLNWLEIDKRKRCNKDEFFENLKKIKNKNFLKSVKLGQQQFEYCWPAT